MASVEECKKSGLPPAWCAHCRAKAQPTPPAGESGRPAVIIAKLHSTCKACPDDIDPGDRLVYSGEFDRWIHESCGRSREWR